MKQINIGNMVVKWQALATGVSFDVFAPAHGWVAIGFNSSNNIVGTNLIMGAAENEKCIVEDHYVISRGIHKQIELLGGSKAIHAIFCTEDKKGITLKFSISKIHIDKFQCSFIKGKKIWFICGYGQKDAFDHHSLMWKHIKVTL